MNKIIIVGNLGNDPEVKSLDNGDEVVNMSIATSETWKDKQSGERRERTEWHRVAIFNPGLVTAAKNYLKKGSKVSIEGQLETCKWQDQNGQDRYSTEVVLRPFRSELTMLDSKGGGAPAACRSQTAGATGKVDDEIRFNPSRRGPCGRGERLASAPVLSRKHE